MSTVSYPVPLGYVACRCGEWVPEPDPGTSIAVCVDCRAKIRAGSDDVDFRYEVDGRPMRLIARPGRKSVSRRNATPERKDAQRRLDRAKIRALWRLRRIYSPMYEVLLAEEKVKQGLNGDATRGNPRPKAIADHLLADIEDAVEREQARTRFPDTA